VPHPPTLKVPLRFTGERQQCARLQCKLHGPAGIRGVSARSPGAHAALGTAADATPVHRRQSAPPRAGHRWPHGSRLRSWIKCAIGNQALGNSVLRRCVRSWACALWHAPTDPTTSPPPAPRPSPPERTPHYTHDEKRNGTTTLFASLNVAEGRSSAPANPDNGGTVKEPTSVTPAAWLRAGTPTPHPRASPPVGIPPEKAESSPQPRSRSQTFMPPGIPRRFRLTRRHSNVTV